MTDILAEICDKKREHLREVKSKTTTAQLEERIKSQNNPRGFISAIKTKHQNLETALIAEIKKASPSKGLIRADFTPSEIAVSYEKGGAVCLSVLTDAPYFQGHDDYIEVVKAAVNLPVLRKDFMVDPYQAYETRAIGADCLLLIMAALNDNLAHEIEAAAHSLGLDVLIEIHNQQELERALKLKSRLIGINNRDLKTLKIDLATTENLIKSIPDDYIIVSESGIYSHDDIVRIQKTGINTFLVGESLMISDNIEAATIKLLNG